MSTLSPTSNTVPGLAKPHRPDARVHGAWLLVARIIWAVVALFDLSLLVITYPLFVAHLGVVCPDPTKGTCGSLQLSPAQVASLQHFHLPLEGYIIYALVADLVVTLLFLVVGVLLFWYRSADRMGLFVSLLFITVGSFGIDVVHAQAFQNPPLVIAIFGTALIFLQWPALGLLFYTFPDGRFVPRWSWLLALLFLIQVGFYSLPYPYNFDNWPLLLSVLEFLVVWGVRPGRNSTAISGFLLLRNGNRPNGLPLVSLWGCSSPLSASCFRSRFPRSPRPTPSIRSSPTSSPRRWCI
jgi:hypothetical protein